MQENMMSRIEIRLGSSVFTAELFDTPTAQAILESLPLESSAILWGDEIYFGIPVQSPLEKEAQEVMEIGDLAYWPSMPAFCIFFGPTPVSLGPEPRAASAVNVFGRLTDIKIDLLRKVKGGDGVRVSVNGM